MKDKIYFFLAGGVGLPWVIIKFSGIHLAAPQEAALSGLAIIGASFLLSWACEAAQKDIPQSLALAILALIAVLPEYAVDMYFAWMAAKKEGYIAYATANMTGANRLLVGGGWALVGFIYFLKFKQKEIKLSEEVAVEFVFLSIATIYSFIIPIKGHLDISDAVIFIFIFIIYIKTATGCKMTEVHLEGGPAALLADLSTKKRRTSLLTIFFYAAFLILISAEAFSEGLVASGKILKIDEFLLVQWLAPIASESPEFIVAAIFAFNGKPSAGMGALISSKVNQWTLLVGMLPLVYNISLGAIAPMMLDHRQKEEILLTSAQSAFAIAMLLNFSFAWWEALILFILFVTQLMIPSEHIRYIYAIVYIILAILIIISSKTRRGQMMHILKIAKSCILSPKK